MLIPDGSMEKKVVDLLVKDLEFEIEWDTTGMGSIFNAPWIETIEKQRPQEMPWLLQKDYWDVAIGGSDWLEESGYELPILGYLSMSRQTDRPARIVIAIPEDSHIENTTDLPRKCTISTEYVGLTKRFLKDVLKRLDIQVMYSVGNTEDKVRFGAVGVVELVETGKSIWQKNLRILDWVTGTDTVVYANPKSYQSDLREYINQFAHLVVEARLSQSRKKKSEDYVDIHFGMERKAFEALQYFFNEVSLVLGAMVFFECSLVNRKELIDASLYKCPRVMETTIVNKLKVKGATITKIEDITIMSIPGIEISREEKLRPWIDHAPHYLSGINPWQR